MQSFEKALLSAAFVYAVVLAVRFIRKSRRDAKLPPGPSGLPVLGNILQLPKGQEWITYRNWGKLYGVLKVPGNLLFIISSHKIVTDLFEQRSALYSDRPHLVLADDIVGWGDSVVMGHYGERFRTNRRLMKIGLGPSAVRTYMSMLESSRATFLLQLEQRPEQYRQLFRNTAGSIGLQIAYGQEVRNDESLVSLTHEVMKIFDVVAMPGAWLVDTIPVLKYVPSWFPFAEFKRYGEYGRQVTMELLNKPYEDVKKRIASGSASASFTSVLLQDMKTDETMENCIKWTATSILAGNSDTSTAALSYFVLAMTLYPEAQAKAQEELDRVIGCDRLPQVSDRPSLPYVDALMKEVLRWHPVVPLAQFLTPTSKTMSTMDTSSPKAQS
ncbi:hypothetical protein NM688_g5901 [Phlebia brevispora]|uniref:Uncharacterized protein n=1 Tax=Phlebia brevispora TaxID=194682 RepID=A0ACC1SN59_9APHY|nr:hypothetical protein NM688_g5901 [Phlebia brevispora]